MEPWLILRFQSHDHLNKVQEAGTKCRVLAAGSPTPSTSRLLKQLYVLKCFLPRVLMLSSWIQRTSRYFLPNILSSSSLQFVNTRLFSGSPVKYRYFLLPHPLPVTLSSGAGSALPSWNTLPIGYLWYPHGWCVYMLFRV